MVETDFEDHSGEEIQLRWATGTKGLHVFPRVPFYRYRRIFDEIEDVMIARGAPIYRLGSRGLLAQRLVPLHTLQKAAVNRELDVVQLRPGEKLPY
jgi:fatty acid desaturase